MSEANAARQQARDLLAVGRYTDVKRVLGQYLAAHPQDAEALTLLARAHLNLDEDTDAVDVAGRALAIDPEQATAWLVRSNALSALGRHTEAVADARRHHALAPHGMSGPYGLAMAMRHVPELSADALTHARRAVTVAPHNASAHNLLGILLAGKHPAEAESCYRRALELEPDNGFARSNLALLSLGKGDVREAMTGFRAATAQQPQNSTFHRNLVLTRLVSRLRAAYLLTVVTAVVAGLVVDEIENDPWWHRLYVAGAVLLGWWLLYRIGLRDVPRHLRRLAVSVLVRWLRSARMSPRLLGLLAGIMFTLLGTLLPQPADRLFVPAFWAPVVGELLARLMGRLLDGRRSRA